MTALDATEREMLDARRRANRAMDALEYASMRVTKALDIERLVHKNLSDAVRETMVACRRCEALHAEMNAAREAERAG